MDKKQSPALHCFKKIHLKYKNKDSLKAETWENIQKVATSQKEARVAILIKTKEKKKAKTERVTS